jgi:hypothetical protein
VWRAFGFFIAVFVGCAVGGLAIGTHDSVSMFVPVAAIVAILALLVISAPCSSRPSVPSSSPQPPRDHQAGPSRHRRGLRRAERRGSRTGAGAAADDLARAALAAPQRGPAADRLVGTRRGRRTPRRCRRAHDPGR